jgi:hypothetical protein
VLLPRGGTQPTERPGGAALLKDCLLQGILQHLHIALSALGNAVNGHVLEHQDSRKEKATGSVAGWLD